MHEIVTFIAKYVIFLSVFLVVWAFVAQPRSQRKNFILVGILGAILSLLLAKIGNHLYYDPRPFVAGDFTPYFPHGNDNGFPSDHTLLAAFFTFLVLRYSKKLGWVLLLLALLVGMARVKAGVHHSIDVLGSFVFAAIGVWIAGFLVGKSGKKPTYIAKKSRN
jgi:undecaprenyl-diphosphatase